VAASFDLYLASKSPRRRELLTQAGLRFALCEPGEEYEAGKTEHDSEAGEPVLLAAARARRKALGVSGHGSRVPVLAVDTVVDLAGCELGKASNRDSAEAFIARLAGHTHKVHTAHCLLVPGGIGVPDGSGPDLRDGKLFEEVASSVVTCDRPDAAQIQRYLDSEQWRGKAGAYGIQDPAQDFLRLVSGSFDTVVGLHVDAVRRLLQAARERA
jgi:septum formation protein